MNEPTKIRELRNPLIASFVETTKQKLRQIADKLDDKSDLVQLAKLKSIQEEITQLTNDFNNMIASIDTVDKVIKDEDMAQRQFEKNFPPIN